MTTPTSDKPNTIDVFISHASEDKLAVARPLASLLVQAGLSVWLDETELLLGDSLRRKIDLGLSRCRFGVVVLSRSFFTKEWPQKELDALVAREDGTNAVILPVWHGVSQEDIARYSPLLSDRLAISTDAGLPAVVAAIRRAVNSRDPNRASGFTTAGAGAQRSGAKPIGELVVELIDRVTQNYDARVEITGLRKR